MLARDGRQGWTNHRLCPRGPAPWPDLEPDPGADTVYGGEYDTPMHRRGARCRRTGGGDQDQRCRPGLSGHIPGGEAVLAAHILNDLVDRFVLDDVETRDDLLKPVPIIDHSVIPPSSRGVYKPVVG